MRTLYFDLLSGASGDMILAACIDLGVPVAFLQEQFARLGLQGLTVDVERQKRSGIEASHMVIGFEKQTSYRHLSQILSIIRQGNFSEPVFSKCDKVLTRLAQAEARVHGIPIDLVHFHEVGAVDTVVDILGAVLCFDYLGVKDVVFSTLVEGHGTITVAHGVMPVPAPATAALMEGFSVRTIDIPTELLTPTGCAILTTLGRQMVHKPEGTIGKTGYGCGDKQFESHPNVLRAMLIETAGSEDHGHGAVTVIESDMDHVSGEIMGFTAEALMQAGALDVSWSPVFMKKGRPGYHLTVVCGEALREKLTDIIICQTRTLGVRYCTMERATADRTLSESNFHGKSVTEKNCSYKGYSFKKLEYEALAALARETKTPLIDLMEEYIRT